MRFPLPSLILAVLLSVQPAAAAEWRVLQDRSSIRFDYTRDGTPATGEFTRLTGEATMSRNAPESAQLVLKIDTESINLYEDFATAFATSAEWFDSRNHRFVTYSLRTLKPREDGRYDAFGDLTLRGETKPIKAIVSLEIGDNDVRAQGTLSIQRRDYLLGVGPSAVFVEIGPEVQVTFDLRATPAN